LILAACSNRASIESWVMGLPLMFSPLISRWKNRIPSIYSSPDDVGKKISGVKTIVLDYGSDPAATIASARYGTELWKLFVAIGFVLLMIEMAIAYGGGQPEVNLT
jgi:hypothetical protein